MLGMAWECARGTLGLALTEKMKLRDILGSSPVTLSCVFINFYPTVLLQ